jgi:hypothetical protein
MQPLEQLLQIQIRMYLQWLLGLVPRGTSTDNAHIAAVNVVSIDGVNVLFAMQPQ